MHKEVTRCKQVRSTLDIERERERERKGSYRVTACHEERAPVGCSCTAFTGNSLVSLSLSLSHSLSQCVCARAQHRTFDQETKRVLCFALERIFHCIRRDIRKCRVTRRSAGNVNRQHEKALENNSMSQRIEKFQRRWQDVYNDSSVNV